MLRSKRISAIIAAESTRDAHDTQTHSRWIRERLKKEAVNKDPRAAGARVRALEMLAKLNGDFAEDNAQRTGFLSEVPSHVLDSLRQRLRAEESDSASEFVH